MCCCQLASAVAHLLPALTSSCLCFVAPKQGPDSTKHKQELVNAGSKCANSEGTCPRRLLYHLFEAPVLGPWAHLGFEKKRPQSLNKRPTKA